MQSLGLNQELTCRIFAATLLAPLTTDTAVFAQSTYPSRPRAKWGIVKASGATVD